MTERPIIFSAPMVRALLAGRKSQTRRVLKVPHWLIGPAQVKFHELVGWQLMPDNYVSWTSVKVSYHVGDLLWVREAWRTAAASDDLSPKEMVPSDRHPVSYEADYDRGADDETRGRLRQPLHMPRWASRITLKVSGVKVERLQDISEEDAKAEGAPLSMIYERESPSHRAGFHDIWTLIHGPGSWEANPWVAAISFERVK